MRRSLRTLRSERDCKSSFLLCIHCACVDWIQQQAYEVMHLNVQTEYYACDRDKLVALKDLKTDKGKLLRLLMILDAAIERVRCIGICPIVVLR
jgi:hypothetical protein